MHTVLIDGNKLLDEQTMKKYLSELLGVDEQFVSTIEKAEEYLGNTLEAYDFILREECVRVLCGSSFGYDVLLMLGRAADCNPFVQVHFEH